MKPNIVLIMADDLGYGDVVCNNPDSRIPTPNVNKLAQAGIRFTDAHSPSSVCTPSRYGLLTGRYCWRTYLKSGVLGGFSIALIEPDRMTIAGMLKKHGYATACVGKWHLGLDWATTDGKYPDGLTGETVDYTKPFGGGPTELGFDYFFGIAAPLDYPPYCFLEGNRTVGIPSVSIKEERDRLPPRYREQRDGLMAPGWKNSEVGPTITRKAVAWLEEHVAGNPDQPFFLYVPTSAPHVPYAPPDFIKGRSQAGRRGDMCAEVDWTVGEVMDAVERLGKTEHTLFIFTSDNGAIVGERLNDALGGPEEHYETYGHKANGDFRGQKWTIYDGGHREPLVARWPGVIGKESICKELAGLTDLFATFAEIVGEELPDGYPEDSCSLLPYLQGGKLDRPVRESLVYESCSGLFSLRRGRWKINFGLGPGAFYCEPIPHKPDGPDGELYDMYEDPGETKNLWLQHPEIVAELKAELDELRGEDWEEPDTHW